MPVKRERAWSIEIQLSSSFAETRPVEQIRSRPRVITEDEKQTAIMGRAFDVSSQYDKRPTQKETVSLHMPEPEL